MIKSQQTRAKKTVSWKALRQEMLGVFGTQKRDEMRGAVGR